MDDEVVSILVGKKERALARRYVTAEAIRETLMELKAIGERRVNQILATEIAPKILRAIELQGAGSPNLKSEWLDCEVSLSARPHPSHAERYYLRVELEFYCCSCDIVLGVTDNEGIADMLCAKYPTITEVLVPSRGMTSRAHIQCYDPTDNARLTDLVPIALSDTDVLKIIGPSAPTSGVRYTKFESPDYTGNLQYRLVFDHELSITTHCFWSAPRRLHLRSVELDFAGFPNADRYEFDIIPRMGVLSVFGSHALKRWSIIGPCWIESGQGVYVNWSKIGDRIESADNVD
ncbi:hypothetical protein [Antrihabitans stalactiti]|uniref:Uncharacterized protein n=1 Tax=Antrihabitans stalactiti TaxID=2584121 RepID=A0A848KK30_9NOCA|nr:hypothetical protein [Antrihabitans stalactiti]NMN98461.1 hypothetical protein [Antrihabitans stalactiti]